MISSGSAVSHLKTWSKLIYKMKNNEVFLMHYPCVFWKIISTRVASPSPSKSQLTGHFRVLILIVTPILVVVVSLPCLVLLCGLFLPDSIFSHFSFGVGYNFYWVLFIVFKICLRTLVLNYLYHSLPSAFNWLICVPPYGPLSIPLTFGLKHHWFVSNTVSRHQ